MSLYDPNESADECLPVAIPKVTPTTSRSPSTSPEPDASDLSHGPRKKGRTSTYQAYLGDAVLLQYLGPNNPEVSGSLLPDSLSEGSDSGEDMDVQGDGPVLAPMATPPNIVEPILSSVAPAVQVVGKLISIVTEASRSSGADDRPNARRRPDHDLTGIATHSTRDESKRLIHCAISRNTLPKVKEEDEQASDGEDWPLRAHLTQGSPDQKLPALNTNVAPLRQESGDSDCSLPSVKLLIEEASHTNEVQAIRNRDRPKPSSYSLMSAASSSFAPSPMNAPLGSPIKFAPSHSMSPKTSPDERSPSATATLSRHTTASIQTPPALPTTSTRRIQTRPPGASYPLPQLTQSTSSDSTRSRGSSGTSTSTETGTSRSQYTPIDGHGIVESPNQMNAPYREYPGVPLGGYKCKHDGCTATAFQTQYLLNSHKNVHSSDRPHYCTIPGCKRAEGGRGFKRKNEMIRHGLVHNSPGYICPYCPDRTHTYPRPDNLQRHVHLHHKDKDKNDSRLRDVLAQRPPNTNTNPSRRRRV